MPEKWALFVDPDNEELLLWFRSEQAGDLCFDRLHPAAQNALLKFERQFTDPFPRIESHGEYVFGMFAAPTSVQGDLADFYTVHFLANFEQIVTVMRCSAMSKLDANNFTITGVKDEIAQFVTLFNHPDWSVGMAITRLAEVFVTQLEQSLNLLKENVLIDLELVTSESRQIRSNADSEYLSNLYRRTAVHKTEVVSLKTLMEETMNIFKAVASNEVDVWRISENINEKFFHLLLRFT